MNQAAKINGNGGRVGGTGGAVSRGGTSPMVTDTHAGSGPEQAEGVERATGQVMPGGFGNKRTQGKNFENVKIMMCIGNRLREPMLQMIIILILMTILSITMHNQLRMIVLS